MPTQPPRIAGTASMADSIHHLQAAPIAEPNINAFACTYGILATLVEDLSEQHAALSARLAEWG